MMASSIEDEAAEAAELMARRGSSVVRNGHEFERRMSKVSRKSQRSSVGGGSNNGSYQGALGTTTAEVITYSLHTYLQKMHQKSLFLCKMKLNTVSKPNFFPKNSLEFDV